MSESLRIRLWMTVQQVNRSFYYQPDPNDNWNQQTDLVDETERRLERLLGKSPLKAKTLQGEEKTGIEAYFKSGFPSCALEVVEQFAAELKVHEVQDTFVFQGEVNDALKPRGDDAVFEVCRAPLWRAQANESADPYPRYSA